MQEVPAFFAERVIGQKGAPGRRLKKMTGAPGNLVFRRTPVKGRDDSKIVVTIQSPISIPLPLHLDVASRHMKFQKNSSFL